MRLEVECEVGITLSNRKVAVVGVSEFDIECQCSGSLKADMERDWRRWKYEDNLSKYECLSM